MFPLMPEKDLGAAGKMYSIDLLEWCSRHSMGDDFRDQMQWWFIQRGFDASFKSNYAMNFYGLKDEVEIKTGITIAMQCSMIAPEMVYTAVDFSMMFNFYVADDERFVKRTRVGIEPVPNGYATNYGDVVPVISFSECVTNHIVEGYADFTCSSESIKPSMNVMFNLLDKNYFRWCDKKIDKLI